MRGCIWEKFRSSLCISGGNRRQPQTPPPPDRAAGGTAGLDLLSALPDDVLLIILGFLRSAAAAARTSVLSRRWRRLWTQLPQLLFLLPEDLLEHAGVLSARDYALSPHWRRLLAHVPGLRPPHPTPARPADPLGRARAALAAHAAPAIHLLVVAAIGPHPSDVAAVLRAAAPRLTDCLFFDFQAPEGAADTVEGVIELLCLENAERIFLRLGYCIGLALPPSGVFDRLTLLSFEQVQFQGPCNLGDAVSSGRCPSLQYLYVHVAQGVSNLDIRSASLLVLYLNALEGLQQLTVVAPMLNDLSVLNSFIGRQPAANITAPVLEKFTWVDAYDPSLVQLGVPRLQELRTLGDLKTEYPNYPLNGDLVMLLQHFQKISTVYLFVYYPPVSILSPCSDFFPLFDEILPGTTSKLLL